MKRKIAILTLGALLYALCLPVSAQQPAKIPLGFISANARAPMSARYEAFRQGLSELGYLEGKNIVIEHRYC